MRIICAGRICRSHPSGRGNFRVLPPFPILGLALVRGSEECWVGAISCRLATFSVSSVGSVSALWWLRLPSWGVDRVRSFRSSVPIVDASDCCSANLRASRSGTTCRRSTLLWSRLPSLGAGWLRSSGGSAFVSSPGGGCPASLQASRSGTICRRSTQFLSSGRCGAGVSSGGHGSRGGAGARAGVGERSSWERSSWGWACSGVVTELVSVLHNCGLACLYFRRGGSARGISSSHSSLV